MHKSGFLILLSLAVVMFAIGAFGGFAGKNAENKNKKGSSTAHKTKAGRSEKHPKIGPHVHEDDYAASDKRQSKAISEVAQVAPAPFTLSGLSVSDVKCVPPDTPFAFSLYYARSRQQPDKYAEYAPKIREAFYAASVWMDASAWRINRSGVKLKVECNGNTPIVRKLEFDEAPRAINWDLITAYFTFTGQTTKNKRVAVMAPESGTNYYGLGGHWQPNSPFRGYGQAVVFQSTAWTGLSHEIAHTLGAVNKMAPHKTEGGHCFDGMSTLCRSNDGTAGGEKFRIDCAATLFGNPATGGREGVFDCGNDDYFNPSPPTGSFLANNANRNLASNQNMFFVRTATSSVDNHPPVIGNVQVQRVTPGSIKVSVYADDAKRVKVVRFVVNGANFVGRLAPVSTPYGALPRYVATIDLSTFGNGIIDVNAYALDDANNNAVSPTVRVQ